MKPEHLKLLVTYLQNGWTMADVDNRERGGRVWPLFHHLWSWSAPKSGGSEGIAHDRFYATHGADAYYRRIARTRAAIARLIKLYGAKP